MHWLSIPSQTFNVLIFVVGKEILASWGWSRVTADNIAKNQLGPWYLGTLVRGHYKVTAIKSRPLVSKRAIFRRKDYFYHTAKCWIGFGKLLHCTPH